MIHHATFTRLFEPDPLKLTSIGEFEACEKFLLEALARVTQRKASIALCVNGYLNLAFFKNIEVVFSNLSITYTSNIFVQKYLESSQVLPSYDASSIQVCLI